MILKEEIELGFYVEETNLDFKHCIEKWIDSESKQLIENETGLWILKAYKIENVLIDIRNEINRGKFIYICILVELEYKLSAISI